MSIATRTGDAGTTGLMYNRRVAKSDPQVEAYGTVDELNTALGMVRAVNTTPVLDADLLAIQKALVILMGELATASEDRERYVRDGFHLVTPEMTATLDALVRRLEDRDIRFTGWATPGACLPSAALDVARTTCRRAERRVCALMEAGRLANTEIPIYLNRLSDVLWLMARLVETEGESPACSAGA